MVAANGAGTKEALSDYWVAEGERIWAESDKTIKSTLKAMEIIEKALKINPLNYKAWADKGFLLKQMGEYDSALMCLNRAISLNSDFIPPLYNKGVLLGLLGRFDEAVDTYGEVLKLDPNHSLAKRDLEMLLKIIKKK